MVKKERNVKMQTLANFSVWIKKGTPVISVTDGEVIGIAEADPYAPYGGGLRLKLSHGDHFDSVYVHLSEIFVEKYQLVKRGQLIGLSGVSNDGWEANPNALI